MRQIKVGHNVKFPDQKQKAHTIVMEIRKHAPEDISYLWAYPKKLNNQGIFFHPKNNQCDLLESFDSPLLTNNDWISMLATAEFGLNTTFNKNYLPRQQRIDILKKILKRKNCKKAIFYSKAGLNSLKTYAGITDKDVLEKSAAVYNAVPKVDPGLLKKQVDHNQEDKKFRILFIGTAFYLKGGAALVDAFEKLQKRYPFIELELHSSLMKPGYMQSEIYKPVSHQKTIQKIKNNPSIFNYNSFEFSRQEILDKVYPRADMFILPSMQEGMPYVLQEAMAYSLPIISTNCVDSIPEIVEHEKNGLIIDVKNDMLKKIRSSEDKRGKKIISEEFHNYLTNEIFKNISKIVQDSRLRNSMRKNNLKKAEDKFSFQKRNKIMKEIYEESVS